LQFTHDIIICTQERTDALRKILTSLSLCLHIEAIEITVIENSPKFDNYEKVAKVCAEYGTILKINLLHSLPGLPRSRNLGIDSTEAQILTFLDDDVRVPSHYFIQMDSFLSQNPSFSGYGPRIAGTRTGHRELTKNAGRVTKSGRSYWFVKSNQVQWADWLPGCAMTFRREAIGNLRFNPQLENGPAGGYALGEDVDFGIRFSRTNKIGFDPQNEIIHELSIQNRSSAYKMELAIGAWHAYLVKNYSDQVKFSKSFAWILLSSIKYLLINLRSKNSYKFPRVRAFFEEIHNPKLSVGRNTSSVTK
jgi:GT2 family glycosyltransferase